MIADLIQYLTMVKKLGQPAVEGFVLDHGQPWQAAALPAGVKKGVPKLCFEQATKLALDNPTRYLYVEGYGLNLIPTLHAWCVDLDTRQVVDPTWDSPELCAYYGVAFNHRYLFERIAEKGFYGLLYDPEDEFRLVRGLRDNWRYEPTSSP